MARDISNSADILDSRDIIARIEELQDERRNYIPLSDEQPTPPGQMEEMPDPKKWAEEMPEDAAELRALLELQEEASGSPGWVYGETLIRDSYFETYAIDLAEDIGAINHNATWPNNHIDWEAATDALKQDYMSVDFDGVEYWIRA